MTRTKKPNDSENTIRLVKSQPASPHSKALYEAGKTILVDSLETGRDFCKSMISTSMGAITFYIAILTFILPDNYILGIAAGGLIVSPAIGFLITSVIFIFGYLPRIGELSLDDLEEIERERNRIITHRTTFIRIGLSFFIISTLCALWVIIINIGVR